MTEQETEPQARKDPDSLAPIQIEQLSVDEELALMSKGRGARLAAVAAGALVSVAIVLLWLKGMDTSQAYASAATSVDSLRQRHSEAFLRCALPGVARSQLDSMERLHSAVERFSEQYGKAYARNLTRCSPVLAGLAPALAELNLPADVSGPFSELRSAAAHLHRSWDLYRSYLGDPKHTYDYVQAVPLIEKISLAWEAYEQRHAALQTALRKHQ